MFLCLFSRMPAINSQNCRVCAVAMLGICLARCCTLSSAGSFLHSMTTLLFVCLFHQGRNMYVGRKSACLQLLFSVSVVHVNYQVVFIGATDKLSFCLILHYAELAALVFYYVLIKLSLSYELRAFLINIKI